MNIDTTKKYTTRDGRPVLIYAVYPKQSWGIHGAVVHEDGRHVPCEWHHDGSMTMTSHELDLVPVKTWRAWEEDEGPSRLMIRWNNHGKENIGIVHRNIVYSNAYLFKNAAWLHEDGSDTPCGVEE